MPLIQVTLLKGRTTEQKLSRFAGVSESQTNGSPQAKS